MILLTDGGENSSHVELARAIESAQRADTLVYSIFFSNLNASGLAGLAARRVAKRQDMSRYFRDAKAMLQRIAQETGGGYFEVSDKNPIDAVFSRIQDELRNQYSLGYSSGQPSPGFHTIHVAVSQPSCAVRSRDGYYSADQ